MIFAQICSWLITLVSIPIGLPDVRQGLNTIRLFVPDEIPGDKKKTHSTYPPTPTGVELWKLALNHMRYFKQYNYHSHSITKKTEHPSKMLWLLNPYFDQIYLPIHKISPFKLCPRKTVCCRSLPCIPTVQTKQTAFIEYPMVAGVNVPGFVAISMDRILYDR